MASIVLPTLEWTRSCQQLYDQLEPDDEFLLVCDTDADPVASAALPEGVELVLAGEPEGCSGKANAVAAALERASQDRIIITDDDVEREGDWLATMKRLGEEHGAVTAVPVFASEEYPFKLLEPLCLVVGSMVIHRSNWIPWGGGVTFDRRDVDMEGYVRNLRRTLSDDGLPTMYLHDLESSRELVCEVDVPGDPRTTLERLTRFVHIFYRFAPRETLAAFAVVLAVLLVGAVFPILGGVGVTLLAYVSYRHLGVDRRTWLFAVPSLLLTPLVFLTLARPTFVWAGRRYRWDDTFDVTVLE